MILALEAGTSAGELSDDVRDAMRVLEDQKARLSRLRAALLAGDQGVSADDFDLENFLAIQHADPG